jgi:hypothetical protein
VLIEFLIEAITTPFMILVELLPQWEPEPIDISAPIGLMMTLNAGFPVTELLALVGLVIAVDIFVFAFDTFNFLWKKIPFIGGS